MKINFDASITDAKGQPVPVVNEKREQTAAATTLRYLAEQALLMQFADEPNLSPAAKVERFKLFIKISGGADDLTPEEIVLLKLCIGKGMTTLAVGRAFDIIEQPVAVPATG